MLAILINKRCGATVKHIFMGYTLLLWGGGFVVFLVGPLYLQVRRMSEPEKMIHLATLNP